MTRTTPLIVVALLCQAGSPKSSMVPGNRAKNPSKRKRRAADVPHSCRVTNTRFFSCGDRNPSFRPQLTAVKFSSSQLDKREARPVIDSKLAPIWTLQQVNPASGPGSVPGDQTTPSGRSASGGRDIVDYNGIERFAVICCWNIHIM